ncbi:MAG: flagellar protein FlgN [Chloroherpetonaceae bacterium]|nr:flagellar protein FlgN [Chthonomonadaceae bacterium]MDW8207712.1 flagellar protein FlgN [Chloroherpetonaceae bacterium]
MPGNHRATQSLIQILQKELLVCRRLVELAEAESEAIIASDIARLSNLEIELRRRLEEQEQLESARIVAVRDIAFALRCNGLPTLAQLLPLLPEREQQVLAQLRVQILEAQAQLEVVTERNRMLLENALEYVRFSLDVLTGTALAPARYGTNLAALDAPVFYLDSKA